MQIWSLNDDRCDFPPIVDADLNDTSVGADLLLQLGCKGDDLGIRVVRRGKDHL
jgi:hypothetical protein